MLSSIYPLGVYFQGVERTALTRGRVWSPSSLLTVGRGQREAEGKHRSATGPGGGVAVRVPLWASINALEMVRLIPTPPLSRLRAASPPPPVEAFEDVSELARWDALAVIGDVDERGGRPLSVDADPDLPAGRGVP